MDNQLNKNEQIDSPRKIKLIINNKKEFNEKDCSKNIMDNQLNKNEQIDPPRKIRLILINDKKECNGKDCGTLIRQAGPKSICIHNNLAVTDPEISKEWDHEKNEHLPSYYSRGSEVKVYWICPNSTCGCHKYEKSIKERVSRGKGCKFCNFGISCPHNNLLITHPKIAIEWDYEKNDKRPENYTFGSSARVHWLCPLNPCGCHNYIAIINTRTAMNSGCKFCNSGAPCSHNNLLITHTELCKEWDYEKNEKGPENYTYGSHLKAHWICNNKHSYEMFIYNKVNYLGCNVCITTGFSKISIEWLNSISERENIHIQCAVNDGEYKIQGIGKVDGYCQETNTVYEFHGDFWYGNPLLFNPEDINPVNNKKYGDLYNKTIIRDELIISKGYNLVTIWERDYRKMRKIKSLLI